MTLRHVGDGLYATETGQHLIRRDTGHPDPAERGWSVLEVVADSPLYPLGVETSPVGPIFQTRHEALAWLMQPIV